MTEEDKKLLHTFEGRMRHLIYLHEQLLKENARIHQLLEQKEAEIAQLKAGLDELTDKYNHLRMARVFEATDDEIKDTKKRIAALVREVDKCIALLNE